MTIFFCDDRSDFAQVFPDVCIRPVIHGIENGSVQFKETLPHIHEEHFNRRWFQDRTDKSLLDNR